MAAVKTYLETLMTLDEAPLKLDPGQVVFSAGDAGREMFIVRTGSVDLRIGDTLLETVEQGGMFGELALVDPAPRSATAVAGAAAAAPHRSSTRGLRGARPRIDEVA